MGKPPQYPVEGKPLQPSAILFDLDGTLVGGEDDVAKDLAAMLRRRFSIELSRVDREFVIGRSWGDIHERLQRHYPRFTMSNAELQDSISAGREHVLRSGQASLTGARSCVLSLASCPLALVTGSSRKEAKAALEGLGLDRAFQFVIASDDVRHGKPHPEGYQLALRRLKTPAHEVVIIEDSETGIAAGRAAGCAVIAVAAGAQPGTSQADAHLVVSSLEALDDAVLSRAMVSARES